MLHTLYYYAEACGSNSSSSSMWRRLPLLLFLLRGETLLSPAPVSFFVALLPLLLLFCLSSSSACCGNFPLASCLLPLPPLAASACFCRFLVFNIHLKLSCPLLAPGCPGSPSPPPSLFLSPSLPSTVLRVLFLHSDYVDYSAVPVDPSLLIVCLTE